MSSDYQAEAFGLLEAASDLERSPEGIAMIEKAIQLADSHNDVDLGVMAREALMDVVMWVGGHDKVLVAFSWCLAATDRKKEDIGMMLLWRYKWVIDVMLHFPGISRTQILAALDDFQNRCERSGYNRRPSLALRWLVEQQMGNLDRAAKWQKEWGLTTRDIMADCDACEANRVVEMHVLRGNHAKAVRSAKAILEGRKRCEEIPHMTFASLLRSFWELGRKEEAEKLHEKGYRLIRSNPEFIREQGQHIEHLLRANKVERASTLVQRHLPWALEAHSLDNQFHFLLAAKHFLQRLESDGIKTFRIKLSEKLCPVAGKTSTPTRELNKWLKERIDKLAIAFDRRNENTWFSELALKREREGG